MSKTYSQVLIVKKAINTTGALAQDSYIRLFMAKMNDAFMASGIRLHKRIVHMPVVNAATTKAL